MKHVLIWILLSLGITPLFAQLDDEFHGRQNATIDFYGKVIDQNGNPLENAKVDINLVVGEWQVVPQYPQQQFVNLRTDKITLGTGTNGTFKLTNMKGHGIEINVSKEGYELSHKVARSYYYSATAKPFHPDSNNPVIFKMWKRVEKEVLVGSNWRGKTACDDVPMEFDLLTGKKAKSGNLRLTCKLAPTNLKWGSQTLSDYKLQIEIIGGGVQGTSDDFTYLAPKDGYLPAITIEEKAADPNHRKAAMKEDFYIKTADGHYGRLSVDWEAWQNPPTVLLWDCSINPSGSRNLER